jgi:hypothetical protein
LSGKGPKNEIIFGGGNLSGAFFCALAALAFPYARTLGLPAYLLPLIFLPAAAVVFLAVPPLYDVINNSPLIATGRYHIPLAIFAPSAALFGCLLFCIDPVWPFAVKAAALFFGLALSLLNFTLFWYVYNAMYARWFALAEHGRHARARRIFSIAGAAAFVAAFGGLFSGGATAAAYSQTGYITGCLTLTAGFCAYIASADTMPKFIRVAAPRRRPLVQKYSRFFEPLRSSANVKIFVWLLVSASSLAVTAFSALGYSDDYIVLTAVFAVFLTSYFAVSAGLSLERFSRARFILPVFLAAVLQLTATALPLIGFFGAGGTPAEPDAAALVSAGALLGAASGIYRAAAANAFGLVLKRSATTRGIIENIAALFGAAAAFIAVAVCSAATYAGEFSDVVGASVSAALCLAALIIFLAKKRDASDNEPLTLEYPIEEIIIED